MIIYKDFWGFGFIFKDSITIKPIKKLCLLKSMETLEITLEKVDLKTKEISPLLVEKSLYEGLQKVEDKVYSGPTSIMYWM